MRSLAPHDVASFKSVSTASIYSQTGQTVRGHPYTNDEVNEADEGKESDASLTESEPEDSALSHGFGIIEALASTDGVFPETHRSWRVLERSVSGEVDMPIEHENTSSQPVGNAMNSSPADSPRWSDTVVTPTAAPRRNTAIDGPSTVLSPGETDQYAQILRQAETPQFTLFDTSPRVNLPISPSPAPPESELPSGPYALVRELESLLGPAVVSQYIHLPTLLGAHDACR